MWHDNRSERYKTRIAECSSLKELRALLGIIIAAQVAEPDFSVLYAEVANRRAKLTTKATAEVWDRETG